MNDLPASNTGWNQTAGSEPALQRQVLRAKAKADGLAEELAGMTGRLDTLRAAVAQERERSEQERQRAEQERQRAEQERQRAEQERQQALQERQRAERERQRWEQEWHRAERLAADLTQCSAECQAMLASTSWQITRPLRWAVIILRRLRR